MDNTIAHFFGQQIWLIKPGDLPAGKALVIKYLKISILAFRGFVNDHCPLRASALTLYTLLSIVPIIAMLFGVAKGFGFETKLQEKIMEQVPEQDTMMLQIIEFAQNLLANTKGGVVAGIGIAVLFWSVIKVISNIEESFNHIWKLKKARTIGRKLSDYLSLMLLAPVLLILSSSITVYVSTQITTLINVVQLPDSGTYVLLNILSYMPLLIIWTLFSFTFIFMPNTKVDYFSGILAGVVTGSLYQAVQSAYLSLQVGVSSYNAIYGSFAALPLFLIWLQIGWLIVLFGSEIAFFHQHYHSYHNKDRYTDLSFTSKKIIALQITHLIIMRFCQDQSPLTVAEISNVLSLPVTVVETQLEALQASKIIAEIKVDEDNDPVYQPARDTNRLTVFSVLEALENNGNAMQSGEENFAYFANIVQGFASQMDTLPGNLLLKEIER